MAALRNVERQVLGQIVLEQIFVPAETIDQEVSQIADSKRRRSLGASYALAGHLFEKLEERAMVIHQLPFETVGFNQSRDADDKALARLDHAEPGFVEAACCVAHRGLTPSPARGR